MAVGLSRLGHHVGYLTKLGKDPFGRRIIKTMEQNGIDPSFLLTDETHATGFMMKSRTGRGDPDIFYFRTASTSRTTAFCI